MSRWPAYFNERLWLVNPKNGFVGVATCWTPKELIAPHLHNKVSVCGQLYTKRGIEFIIRNLYLNPRIRYLVVVGKDATGSGQALVNFFQKGVDRSFLPLQISEKYLNLFREKVRLIDLRGEIDVQKINKKIESLRKLPPFARKKKRFKETKTETEVYPSEASGFRVEAETVGLAWLQILKIILRFGWEIPRVVIYGGKEKMVLNLVAVITGEDIKKPKMYRFFPFKKKDLKSYFKNFFSTEIEDQGYTYGERILKYQKSPEDLKTVDQLNLMAKKLKSFSFNKGALITLWNPSIDNYPIRKPWRTPCLTLIQGICCQEDKLHLTAYFRSNDMFGAWPQNAFALRRLQFELAKKVSKKMGILTTISHSAFIDNTDLQEAQKLVDQPGRFFCQFDPRGNLIISVENKEIVVKQISPGGLFLQEFRQDGAKPRAALKMASQLLKFQAISQIGHALDIGEQLGKAEIAIKLGLKFEQDQPLKTIS
ncbi:hypothetical protein ISS42_02485 [Candidatus Shapirobacteria bacterium]|nr:hypothetical protein [Candidatus Shapirobacteria bacterium]